MSVPPLPDLLLLPLSTLRRSLYNCVLTDFIVTGVQRRLGSTLISSSFLLFLGLGVLRREAWILNLSFDDSFSWGLSNLLFFIALFLFPPRVFSSHLQETCSFTSVLSHYLLHL